MLASLPAEQALIGADASLTTIAVYSWPFLLSAVVGLIVWIWKERVAERSVTRFEQTVNLVRTNFATAMNSHREMQDKEMQQTMDKVRVLERTVFGVDGGNGLRSDMKKVKHGIRALILMRSHTDAEAGSFDVQALMSELE